MRCFLCTEALTMVLEWIHAANIICHVKVKINTAAAGSDRTNAALHFYLTFMSADMIFPVLCFDRQVDHCCTVRTTICPRRGRKQRLGTSWDRYVHLQYRDRPAACERWVSALHWIIQTTKPICHTPARKSNPWTPCSPVYSRPVRYSTPKDCWVL